MKLILIKTVLGLTLACAAQEKEPKVVKKNSMTVQWYYANDRIHLEMEAPTNGWVAIGFHEEASLADAYLIMGAVNEGRVVVEEHYTHQPGSYQSIQSLNGTNWIEMPDGDETNQKTRVAFSLPLRAPDQYRKSLQPGQTYHFTLAYSREDDFQHHSMMRTSLCITL